MKKTRVKRRLRFKEKLEDGPKNQSRERDRNSKSGTAVPSFDCRRQQQQQQDRRLDVLALNDDSTKKDEDENDEMPVIPDLEDVYDEEMTTQIAAPPSVQVNRLDTFRKLDTDLHRHAGLSTLGGEIDLKLLTKVLYPESDVLEDDVPWEWDRLFAEVASELQQEWKKSSKTTDSPVKDDRS
eukprot:m.16658 g.16658  ORF g.16658 m.16658 type:complete len:182 (+) comp27056_c0_seq3:260-805(+)